VSQKMTTEECRSTPVNSSNTIMVEHTTVITNTRCWDIQGFRNKKALLWGIVLPRRDFSWH